MMLGSEGSGGCRRPQELSGARPFQLKSFHMCLITLSSLRALGLLRFDNVTRTH